MRGWVFLILLAIAWPALAEPGVVLLHDSRRKDQSEIVTTTRRCLYLLLQKNQLPTYQFTLFSADFADRKTAASWKSLYGITPAELPAVAFFTRNGNKITLQNVIRRINDPVTAAQAAFTCAQGAYPGLVKETALPTGIALASEPLGAKVMADGHEVGTTPCVLPLSMGLHILELKHPYCEPFDQTVTVLPGVTMPVNISLKPLPAQLEIESSGVPLTVTLDDGAEANTPYAVGNVTAGPHRLRAQALGYYAVDTTIELTPHKLNRVRLTPSQTRLRVGWGGATAEGYTKTSTSYGRYRVPFITTTTVYLDQSLLQRLRDRLSHHPRIELVEGTMAVDCSVKFDIKASENDVRGQVRLLNTQGGQTTSLTADRDMPFFSFDETGAANKRAEEICDELTDRISGLILERVQATTGPPEGAKAPLQLTVEDPPTI